MKTTTTTATTPKTTHCFLVMLKCYGYQHNYILIYAIWWLIIVRCTWDGLDPSAPMTRRKKYPLKTLKKQQHMNQR